MSDAPDYRPKYCKDQAENGPERPWFKIHLSTVLTLIFVGAGLLWLNLRSRTIDYVWTPNPDTIQLGFSGDPQKLSGDIGALLKRRREEIANEHSELEQTSSRGWPVVVWTRTSIAGGLISDIEWSPDGAVIDVFSALVALAAVSAGSEWIIRRKLAKAQPPSGAT